jgi:hypothetical protein
VALLLLYLVWTGYRSRRVGAALLASSLACVVVMACILPFTLRNYRVYGEFLLLNSNTGFALYSAQHPMHGTAFREYVAAPLPTDLAPMPVNEAQWERALLRRGLGFIAADPVRYARLSLSRVADYFIFWPAPQTSLLHNLGRTLSFGLLLPFMLYGLWLSRRMGRRLRLLYLFMLCYSLLHILTWAMSRYRLPVDAVLLVFAALALVEVWGRLRRRLPRSASQGTMRQLILHSHPLSRHPARRAAGGFAATRGCAYGAGNRARLLSACRGKNRGMRPRCRKRHPWRG